MRTRNNGIPKSPALPPKKTPPSAKISAGKAQTPSSSVVPTSDSCPVEMATPNTVEPKRPSDRRTKQAVAAPDSKPNSSVETAKESGEASQVKTVTKPAPGTRKVKKVIRRVVKKKSVSGRNTRTGAAQKAKIEETKENAGEDLKNADEVDNKPLSGIVGEMLVEDESVSNVEESSEKEEHVTGQLLKDSVGSGEEFPETMDPIATGKNSMKGQEPEIEKRKEALEEQTQANEKADTENKTLRIENNHSDEVKSGDILLEDSGGEKIEGLRLRLRLSDQDVHEELGGEDLGDDDAPRNEAETEALKEEHFQLNVAARERKVRKEREIFVGGLDRDAVEGDIRKVFQYAGDVVEVRINMDPSTNKNKGYAFVQFATKEQASRALSEMKNPVIHGKRCGTCPSEDNDTLFLGNICNTWTKEAIKQKLKDYGVEGVENINLVSDPRYEGLSRGFAFIEFSSHAEAMLAYKRLQKPDVVFGHSERTARVAFAEPLREPDPEVMAQVKSVFVDGIPPYWDEDRAREKFKVFGQIARIVLARNMSTAKRKDFGFVDFSTHAAAVSCVEGVNSNGLRDGNSKVIKVRARLSNPSPKMQAVKGGMCGGFRIGTGSSGSYPRSSGRGSGRGAHPFRRPNLQHSQGFYPPGPGNGVRMSFPNEHEFHDPYPQRRQSFERGRWGFGDAPQGRFVSRPYPDRVRHGATSRDYGEYDSYRSRPYNFEEGYDGSFMERPFDDPYPYDDLAPGIKRPYYMMDQDPDIAEPSRLRARLDYTDPTAAVRGSRYRDDIRADGGFYSRNYHGFDYGASAYSPFYGHEQAYGRGYYY